MIKKVRLRRDGRWFMDRKKALFDGKWNLCVSPLYKIFDIPESADIVWLTAHKRPGVSRVKVELAEWDEIRIDGVLERFLCETGASIERLLKKHGTFYVSVEYVVLEEKS